jgi:hypothetical protein
MYVVLAYCKSSMRNELWFRVLRVVPGTVGERQKYVSEKNKDVPKRASARCQCG